MKAECGVRSAENKVHKHQLTAYSSLLTALPDIRDIRGPIHIPYPWLWVVYLLGVLALGALILWGYRAWKKSRPKPIKLPHEIALEKLQSALSLIPSGQAREFSIIVSEAVRIYIQDRFHLRAAHRTTEEFLHDLLTNPESPVAIHGPALEDFLKHCDLAKFARGPLSSSEMQAMFESAKAFIEKTNPQIEMQREKAFSKKPGLSVK